MVNEKVTGLVKYSVTVACPHCGYYLNLNRHPYIDGEQNYNPAEDLLGYVVFGSFDEPAQWLDFKIKYKCLDCKKDFILNELEM